MNNITELIRLFVKHENLLRIEENILIAESNMRCTCGKRVVATFNCKCGIEICNKCRDNHGCEFNHVKAQQDKLNKELEKITSNKGLDKI